MTSSNVARSSRASASRASAARPASRDSTSPRSPLARRSPMPDSPWRHIDGIATMGETPVAETAAHLGIDHSWTGSPSGKWGLLSPVVNAFHAVARGEARHVLVYRTVHMIGGSVLPSGEGGSSTSSADTARAAPPVEERGNPMADVPRLITAHAYSAANWLALHARRHMHQYGTTKEQLGWLALNSRRNAALNPRGGLSRPAHDAGLPGCPHDLGSLRSARLRRPGRWLRRVRGVLGRGGSRL